MGISSSTAPEGFESFFSQQTGTITVNLYGETIKVPGKYSLRSAAVDASARAELERFLTDFGVKPRILTPLMDSLISGVQSSGQCRGLIADCAIYPERYDFIFIDEARELKIFINENDLTQVASRRFFDADEQGGISLVNTTQFYGQVSDGSPSMDWQNETNLALPIGYFQSDTALISDDDRTNFEVYEANYVIDRQGYSFSGGYDRTPNIDNSARSLSLGQNTGGYHLTLFSNQRLAARNKSSYDAMSVFVAENTELEILRGDRVIYRTILQQGLNNISYSTFDQGSYNVVLRYKVGGQVIREENRHVYNVPFFTMDKGEYDWFVQGGELENDDFGDYNFLKGGFAGRFTDNAMLGAGYTNVDGYSLASAYGEIVPIEGIRSSLLVSSDFGATTYLNAYTSVYSAYVSGEYMRTDKDSFRSLYGSNEFSQLSAGFSFHSLGSQHMLSYQKYVTEADPRRNQGKSDISSLILNSSRAFKDFTLSASLQHDWDKSPNGRDSWMVGVSVDVPLDDFRVASSYNRSKFSGNRMRNALQYNTKYDDNTSVNAEVAILNYETEEGSNVSGQLSAYHTNDVLNASTNMYMESADRYNASINVSSTQLVNKNNLLFTSERARTFVVMDNDAVTGVKDGENLGIMEMRNRSNRATSVVAMDKKRKILPVEPYSQYQINMETANSQYITVDDKNYNYFAKPGTFLQAKNNMMRIKRYIVSFTDQKGAFPQDLRCVGLGCQEIEEIADNVYQVSLFEEFGFTLHSGTDICLLPNGTGSAGTGRVLNVGRSVCMDRLSLAKMVQDMPEGLRLFYMGTQLSPDNRQTSNTKYVPVGKVYARFLYSRDGKILTTNGFSPRQVNMPGRELDNSVAQEL